MGDPDAFNVNWQRRKESIYNHWVATEPRNQIQFAFRNHYEVYKEILARYPPKGKKFLETGCGRGTISSYFNRDGWDTTLLDYNQNVLDIAKNIFENLEMKAEYVTGDALSLPFEDETFDVITNIGLLEHFEDIQKVINEQTRVLRKNGWCLSYVVPERPENIQKYFNWLNKILKSIANLSLGSEQAKVEIFRSNNLSSQYLECLKDLPVRNIMTFGMYPLPMISHSPDFPFSLMPQPFEKALVIIFKIILMFRKLIYGKHGWSCSERFGQAFLIAYQKDGK